MSEFHILNFGVDSFYIGYYVDIESNLLENLEELKEKSSEGNFGENEKIKVSETLFEVKPFGNSLGYKYILSNDMFAVFVSDVEKNSEKFENNYPFPNVFIQVRSKTLWGLGFYQTTKMINSLLNEMTINVYCYKINRIDLSVDYQGINYNSEDIDDFVTKARYRSFQTVNDYNKKFKKRVEGFINKFRSDGISDVDIFIKLLDKYIDKKKGFKIDNSIGFQFGKKNFVARIYDKTIEIRTSQKEWVKELWKKNNNYDEEKNVYRLEFQIRDLKSFGVKEDIRKLLEGINSIWQYSMEWLSHRNNDKSRITRSKNKEYWNILKDIDFKSSFNFDIEDVKLNREQVYISDEKQLRSMIKGCATSLASMKEINDKDKIKDELIRIIEEVPVNDLDIEIHNKRVKYGFE